MPLQSPSPQEDWPQPELALYLANSHGLSSLAVDPAGRGESCGYEYGPGYEGLVRARANGFPTSALQASKPSVVDSRLAIWQLLLNSSTACREDMQEPCLVRQKLPLCELHQHIASLLAVSAQTYAGLSSGATSSLFYASQIANIPAIFTCEPDDMAVLPGTISVVAHSL